MFQLSIDDLNSGAILSVAADKTLETKHKLVLVDTSAGDVTITPASMSGMLGKAVVIKKTSASNSLIIDPAGSVNVDGASTKTLSDNGDFVILTSDGTQFITIGRDAAAVIPGDIAGLSEAIDDRVNALLVAGNNIDLTYDDTANTLTVDVEALTAADITNVSKKTVLSFTGITLKALFSDPSVDQTEIVALSEELFPADSIIEKAFVRVNTADTSAETTVLKLGQDAQADDFVASVDLKATGTTAVSTSFVGVLIDALADLKADVTKGGAATLSTIDDALDFDVVVVFA